MDTNRCVLQGRLTCDPVLRMTQTGRAVASFRIAVGLTRDRTLFISAQAWGKTAELIRQYLHKGSPAIFDGRLEPDEYTGRDGQPRCETILVAEGFSFCGPPPQAQPRQPQGYPPPPGGEYVPRHPVDDRDVPRMGAAPPPPPPPPPASVTVDDTPF